MMVVGAGLCSVAVVVRDNSTEPFFPFDFAVRCRREIGSKNLVSNIHTLMRSMVVIVRKPFAVNVIELLHAEAEKVVKTLSFYLSDIHATNEFARGERTGVLIICVPELFQNSSNRRENFVSRSRIK